MYNDANDVRLLDGSLLAGAGVIAGAANAIVGSGSLLTFPTLIGLGYSPLVSNVSNSVGLVFGTMSGGWGYRRELAGQGPRVVGLGGFALVGGAVGALLLLVLPAGVFQSIVPALVLFAVLLVAIQPWLSGLVARHGTAKNHAVVLRISVFATGIYGGYFGAAQGVILIACLSVLLSDSLQRVNGLKNVLMALATIAPAVIFTLRAPVAWEPTAVIAVSSVVGAQLGALVGRRLSPTIMRAVIVLGGLTAFVVLVT